MPRLPGPGQLPLEHLLEAPAVGDPREGVAVTEPFLAGIGRHQSPGALLHLAFQPQGLGLQAGHQVGIA